MELKDVISSALAYKIKNSRFYINLRIKRNRWVTRAEAMKFLETAPPVLMADRSKADGIKIGIVKDSNFYESKGLVSPRASWLRYERFCINNGIRYGFYDIYRSDWIEQAAQYDIIVWQTDSNPAEQHIAESKIYVLEHVLKKECFPSFHEVWQYEDKCRENYLYSALDIPSIPTVVTNSLDEALHSINTADYPFIYKDYIGTGSREVVKIDSRSRARKLVYRIFMKGKKGLWGHFFVKNIFYMQKFMADATFDLRVMMSGDKAFGYYRYPKKGDFKASGAGNYEKKEIPEDVLRLAYDIKRKLGVRQVGVDFLYSPAEGKYYVIETSVFNRIDTPEQLVVNGVAGYYDMSDLDNITFRPGKFWIQELTLQYLVESHAAKKEIENK